MEVVYSLLIVALIFLLKWQPATTDPMPIGPVRVGSQISFNVHCQDLKRSASLRSCSSAPPDFILQSSDKLSSKDLTKEGCKKVKKTKGGKGATAGEVPAIEVTDWSEVVHNRAGSVRQKDEKDQGDKRDQGSSSKPKTNQIVYDDEDSNGCWLCPLISSWCKNKKNRKG